MRITQTFLRAQVGVINGLLGFPDDAPAMTPGMVTLYSAYGGYGVHRYSEWGQGSVSDLMGGAGTARECSNFLAGMIAALRIASER